MQLSFSDPMGLVWRERHSYLEKDLANSLLHIYQSDALTLQKLRSSLRQAFPSQDASIIFIIGIVVPTSRPLDLHRHYFDFVTDGCDNLNQTPRPSEHARGEQQNEIDRASNVAFQSGKVGQIFRVNKDSRVKQRMPGIVSQQLLQGIAHECRLCACFNFIMREEYQMIVFIVFHEIEFCVAQIRELGKIIDTIRMLIHTMTEFLSILDRMAERPPVLFQHSSKFIRIYGQCCCPLCCDEDPMVGPVCPEDRFTD
mmetsp:Transcript_74743/g.132169  ORF Transcript_74743/g.132169 Transcript_74743/m.132169 type:complete len:255 (-) Transcript_74743:991-1755(-)